MSKKITILVLDTIPFPGGSKVATQHMLDGLDSKEIQPIIATIDAKSWQGFRTIQLFEPKFLRRQEQGMGYFLRHGILALNLIWLRLRIGAIHTVLGASGPGNDCALYFAKWLCRWDIVQIIHGPVARSKTLARCLLQATAVHYLPSTRNSILSTLGTRLTASAAQQTLAQEQFQTFINGLPSSSWPTPCQAGKPVLFWAASLLKWKGLDLLLEALKSMPAEQRPDTHICYIRPQNTTLPISQAPIELASVQWHENPDALDGIRAQSNIFISTSQQEPFGLSILEALAAGQCVVIPQDGAYWDQQLEDQHNCIKYQPGNAKDLLDKLLLLIMQPTLYQRIGQAGALLAERYRAEPCYQGITASLQAQVDKPPHQSLRQPL